MKTLHLLLVRFLLVILTFSLVFCFGCGGSRGAYQPQPGSSGNDSLTLYQTYVNDNSTWMARIDGKVKLSHLTLPGTHDTMAMHGNGWSQFQDKMRPQQLQYAIRFIDIRLRCLGENFSIQHADFYQWAYFDSLSDYSANTDCQSFVLDDCIQFLTDNPTECVV